MENVPVPTTLIWAFIAVPNNKSLMRQQTCLIRCSLVQIRFFLTATADDLIVVMIVIIVANAVICIRPTGCRCRGLASREWPILTHLPLLAVLLVYGKDARQPALGPSLPPAVDRQSENTARSRGRRRRRHRRYEYIAVCGASPKCHSSEIITVVDVQTLSSYAIKHAGDRTSMCRPRIVS